MKNLQNDMVVLEGQLLEKEGLRGAIRELDQSRSNDGSKGVWAQKSVGIGVVKDGLIKRTEQEIDASLGGDEQSNDGTGRQKTAERLVSLVLGSGSEIYLDEQGDPHITFSEKPLVGFPIHGVAFRRWLSGKYWDECGKGFSTESLNQAIGILEGQAFHRNNVHPLFNRAARHENIFYYDLGDDQRMVRIDENGWQVLTKSPVRFRRFKHQQQQVVPAAGGDLRHVLQFINLRNEKDKLLFLTYLVAALVPDIPRVILVHVGDQGAAKSTVMRVVRSLIDPSHSDLLSPPADLNELGQLANHHYCLYFDNLSVLRDELSDILCRLATGIGFSKRKLYTDDEDVLFNQRVAVGLNGINLVAQKADVLDRCLILNLERIPDDKRLGEEEFWQSFRKRKPLLLGALFSTLSQTLKVCTEISLPKRPRMADYALYAASAAVALGESAEAFLAAFEENTSRQNQAAIESSPIAQTILEFMEDKTEWSGTSSELYGQLKPLAEKASLPLGGTDGFPKGSNWLWKKIKVVRPNLQSLGIDVGKEEKSVASVIKILKGVNESKNTATTTTTATESDANSSRVDGLNGSMAAMAAPESNKGLGQLASTHSATEASETQTTQGVDKKQPELGGGKA